MRIVVTGASGQLGRELLLHCSAAGDDVIGLHPHIHYELQYDCLVGGPPGIYIEGDQLTLFVAQGQAPGPVSPQSPMG